MDADSSNLFTLHVFDRSGRTVYRREHAVLDEITEVDFDDEDTVWSVEPSLAGATPLNVHLAPRAPDASSAFRIVMLTGGFVLGGGVTVLAAGMTTIGVAVACGVLWLANVGAV